MKNIIYTAYCIFACQFFHLLTGVAIFFIKQFKKNTNPTDIILVFVPDKIQQKNTFILKHKRIKLYEDKKITNRNNLLLKRIIIITVSNFAESI